MTTTLMRDDFRFHERDSTPQHEGIYGSSIIACLEYVDQRPALPGLT
jgi:hypothetical protein